MRVKPPLGKQVRDPDPPYKLIDGEVNVPQSNYWLRRLVKGDVFLVGPKPEAKPKKAKTVKGVE